MAFWPSCCEGTFSRLAVNGDGSATTSSVASLVRDSSLLWSSVRLTRTLMVWPCWAGREGVGGAGDVRPSRNPLVGEGGVVQAVLVGDA